MIVFDGQVINRKSLGNNKFLIVESCKYNKTINYYLFKNASITMSMKETGRFLLGLVEIVEQS